MKIIFFGDVMPGRDVARILECDIDLLSKISSDFEDSSFKICNLEAPVVQNVLNPYRFYTTEAASTLIRSFNAVTLANNHIFDQDINGLFETIKILDKWGVSHTGAGSTKDDAFKPIVIEANGKTVVLLGLTSEKMLPDNQYLNHIALIEDTIKLHQFISEYRCKANMLIVLPHMGVEYVDCPAKHIKKAFRNLIDIGFDMVIASHPHVIQGTEVYKGKLICYSLGDFIFDNLNSLRSISMYVTIFFSSGGNFSTKYCISKKNISYQPFNIPEEYVSMILPRLNYYIKSKYAYYFRFLICKSLNQIYSISHASRTKGLQGLYSILMKKLELLVRMLWRVK